MKSQSLNNDNQWQTFLRTGKNVPLAIKPKKKTDVQKALKAKYPGVPIPTHRPTRMISAKQRRAVKRQEGERQ